MRRTAVSGRRSCARSRTPLPTPDGRPGLSPPGSRPTMKFREAVRAATVEEMRKDARVFVLGIGVPDVKGIFGTTVGLADEFGGVRALGIPIAERAVEGICCGSY